MNRRSFIKAASFYGASVWATLTLGRFPFFKKSAEAIEQEPLKKYRWVFCDDVRLERISRKLSSIRFHIEEKVVAVIHGDADEVFLQMQRRCRYQNVDLLEMGIDNAIVRCTPAISYKDAKILHSKKLLGRRLYVS
jgi:hypothetical protein